MQVHEVLSGGEIVFVADSDQEEQKVRITSDSHCQAMAHCEAEQPIRGAASKPLCNSKVQKLNRPVRCAATYMSHMPQGTVVDHRIFDIIDASPPLLQAFVARYQQYLKTLCATMVLTSTGMLSSSH